MKLLHFNDKGEGYYGFRVEHRGCTYFGKVSRHEFKSKFWEARQIGAILRGDEIRQMTDRKFQIVKRGDCDYLSIATFFRKNDQCVEIQETNMIPIKPICKSHRSSESKLGSTELLVKRRRQDTREENITGFCSPAFGRSSFKQEESGAVELCGSEKELSVRVKELEDLLTVQKKETELLEKCTADVKDQLRAMGEKMSAIHTDNILLKKQLDDLEQYQYSEKKHTSFFRSTLQLLFFAQPFECRFYYNNTARLDRLQHEVALSTTTRSEQRYFSFLCQHPRFQEFKPWLRPRRCTSLIYTVLLRDVPRECECLLNPIDVFKFGKMGQVRDFYTSGTYLKSCTYQKNDVDFLVTLYEINLEYELLNKSLLPGGVCVVEKSAFQKCMSSHVENIGSHTFCLKSQTLSTVEENPGAGKQKAWSDKLGYFVTFIPP